MSRIINDPSSGEMNTLSDSSISLLVSLLNVLLKYHSISSLVYISIGEIHI